VVGVEVGESVPVVTGETGAAVEVGVEGAGLVVGETWQVTDSPLAPILAYAFASFRLRLRFAVRRLRALVGAAGALPWAWGTL